MVSILDSAVGFQAEMTEIQTGMLAKTLKRSPDQSPAVHGETFLNLCRPCKSMNGVSSYCLHSQATLQVDVLHHSGE